MSVSLPKETVKALAKLRLINILATGKKKTAEDLATEILDVLEKELHFDVVEEK
jgi:ribosomal protein S7